MLHRRPKYPCACCSALSDIWLSTLECVHYGIFWGRLGVDVPQITLRTDFWFCSYRQLDCRACQMLKIDTTLVHEPVLIIHD